MARIISVKIDKLALEYFDSPEDFAKAMKLLYEAAQHSHSAHDFQVNFLENMEGSDDWFYSKAINFNRIVKDEFVKLQTEITFLKEAILNDKSTSATPEALEELLNKFDEKINPQLSDDDNPTLNQLFEIWQQFAQSNYVASSFENTYKPAIELFLRFVHDLGGKNLRINSLNVAHIRHFQKYYQQIPKGTVASNFTIAKLIKLNGEGKSSKTIIDTYSNIGTFLNWIATKGYPINGNLQKVLTKGSDIKVQDKDKNQRVPFSDRDLQNLFNSEKYTKTRTFKTSAMYWAPLISLFTGARMSEILQLEKHDIKKVDGVYIFSITDLDPESTDSQKHVKQDGSRREVPIHNQLLSLGFIEYCDAQKGRLFPDEPRNKTGKFDLFQKRFATYRKQVDVKPENEKILKDFHSFRHTVRTRLTELRTTGRSSQQFDEGIIDAIVGHASRDRSIGQSTYNHSQYIKAKKKALDRLEYQSIDFRKIVSWNKCDFIRNQHREKMRAKLSKG